MADTKFLYVVSSFRDYGDNEKYYGVDGIFDTEEQAEDYIRDDMEETNEMYEDYLTVKSGADCYAEYILDMDEHYFSWRIDAFNELPVLNSDRTYIVTEFCPNCESEIEMRWNTDDRGYQAFCPVCCAPLMLCDECRHSDDFKDCDWADGTCHRMKKEDKQNGND